MWSQAAAPWPEAGDTCWCPDESTMGYVVQAPMDGYVMMQQPMGNKQLLEGRQQAMYAQDGGDQHESLEPKMRLRTSGS